MMSAFGLFTKEILLYFFSTTYDFHVSFLSIRSHNKNFHFIILVIRKTTRSEILLFINIAAIRNFRKTSFSCVSYNISICIDDSNTAVLVIKLQICHIWSCQLFYSYSLKSIRVIQVQRFVISSGKPLSTMRES